MFGKKRDDWKNNLNDADKKILAEILDSTKKYRFAYKSSDDVKIAQLWTALIEFKKELNKTNELLEVRNQKSMVEIGDDEKKRTIDKIVKEVVKGVDETTDESTQRLVESLMKF